MTPEDLAKLPYLSKVHIPGNVDLLIRTNVLKLLEPWEVIHSCGNGPYVVRTMLGLVFNGPLNGNSGVMEAEVSSAIMNRISKEEKEMSREDLKFM